MAKKKKTQLKPVARGFATTSVPKKVTPVETPEPEERTVHMPEAEEKVEVEQGKNVVAVPSTQSDEFDPDKVEEQSLQNLVDRLQEKTEKEITRTLKAIEMDRRFSRTLPRLELDSALVDRVIALVLESDPSAEVKRALEEPEDRAIARLGITYGVLRRLGFSESRVEECLRAIQGIDLEEAYEWLYLHCTEEELLDKRAPEVAEPKTPRTPAYKASRTPQTPRTPAEFLIPPTPTPKPKPSGLLDANAPTFVPSGLLQSLPIKQGESSTEESDQLALKARILASFGRASSASESGDDSPVSDDPALQYAQTKLRLENLSANGYSGDAATAAEVQVLRHHIAALKASYFFDEKEAEAMYRLERDKANAAALQDRLRGTNPTPGVKLPPRNKGAKKRPPNLQPGKPTPTPSTDVCDIFDDDGDDSATGGVLEILDRMPATETDAQGKLITIRDMALPKHWSGRTPKTLLQETVAKADRYAAISYSIASGASRAKRASVSIRWEGRKTDDWAMEDVACHDEGQAEQYIATVALHALTFPPTDGFAASASTAPGSQTFFRLLPAVFRDLWDELEASRKIRDDTINRNVWATLRSIIEPKLEGNAKVNGSRSKDVVDAPSSQILRSSVSASEIVSEQLSAGFRARQASPEYQEMLLQRNSLPIAEYRETIVQMLEQSQVLVLSGETGCGKSTQVPAFILEDQLLRGKPCKIYCTEPRRISAISLAQRVSRELGEPPSAVGTINSLVGYSIRLESNTTRNTRLAFVTNGIALRMLEGGTGQGGQGTAFDEITHIIVDEVHERTIESDFLLIVLKSLLAQRPDLRVILMSATVDAEKISEYFGGCPTLHVPGRTFPVDVQFLEDAVEYTRWSISESSPYARRLHDKFYQGKARLDWTEELAAGDDDDDEAVQENVKLEKRYSPETAATIDLLDERLIPYDLILRLLERICFEDPAHVSYSAAILIFMPGLAEIRRLNDMLNDHPSFGARHLFKLYPLHSTLSSENQSAVFDIPPPGVRKIVIATNIAETGITIPDITCVIDSGKHREMRFDEKRQISRLVETFIAKSNAAQRRGRAGRVHNGLCFHLFTKLRHDTQMAEHPLPEMMRLSLSDLALRIKIMKVRLGSSIEDVLSRALDPPASINVQRAVSMLVEVRALTPSEEITPMGRLLSKLPTDVHLGKFLLIATLFRCLDPALTIAAALNSKSPFVSPFGFEQEADRAKQAFKVENSDFLTIHNAFASWRRASANPNFVRKFCRTNYLSHQNLQQIEELRQQFLGYLIDSSFIQVDRAFVRELSRARYGRHRTRFVSVPPELDVNSGNVSLINAALTAGLFPKILAIDPSNGQMRTISNNQQALFHPSSVNFGKKISEFGVYHLAYFTLMHSKRLYAWETGPVDDMAMLLLCGECDFKLISDSAFIDRKIKFRIPPKSNIALKFLRSQLGSLLAHQFRGKTLSESQLLWNELAMMVLGKIKPDVEQPSVVIG
ncbi:putative P-loop containing nucleoside triphosphate hydrolase protein [Lyophyllum shimeji]|uniref:RNA helicase n=1 Tax=Lyophyllum shimeji TaxID=47721 RepID=A0A9P3PHX6_LYOSH|nr:putative P-loop containing nucleoside triphosphate hydrolase protein [Lyophyllum shimeji]